MTQGAVHQTSDVHRLMCVYSPFAINIQDIQLKIGTLLCYVSGLCLKDIGGSPYIIFRNNQ